MKNKEAIQERYLRDAVPIRLGGLAADLARVRSFSRNSANREVVEGLIDESLHFIEWTVGEVKPEVALSLRELTTELETWQQQLDSLWPDDTRRQLVADRAGMWSQRVLEFSGLLETAA